ncbi:MAG: hypothetical protein IH984_08335 [Planctomycetes bacterium]|nr:hypothetical protein [Planctomycetota bacterium]
MNIQEFNILSVGAWLIVIAIYVAHLIRFREKKFLSRHQSHKIWHYIPIVAQIAVIEFGVGRIDVERVALITSMLSGALCIATGLIMFVWAMSSIGRWWDFHVSVQESQELIAAGPYRVIAHPVFFGKIMILVGTALYGVNVIALVLALFSAGILLRRAMVEERILGLVLGQKYYIYRLRHITRRFSCSQARQLLVKRRTSTTSSLGITFNST